MITDLLKYETSLTAGAQYKSFQSEVSSVIPQSDQDILMGTKTDLVNALAGQTAAPQWWNSLDSDAQSYYASMAQAEYKIVTSDLNAPAAPTGVPGAKAAFVAFAGAVGGAVLLM